MVDAVLQMKRAGVFESFLLTMMQQPEAMSVLAELITTNESFNRKLDQSIFEAANSDEEDEEDEDEEDEDEDEEDEDEDEDEEDEDEDEEDEDEDEDD